MSNIICGIDFSINSTAMVVKIEGVLKFYSFVPNFKSSLKQFKMHNNLSEFINVISYDKIEKVNKDSIITQSNKLKNADELSNKIIEQIELLKKVGDIIEFRIEGFSYASSGNSFIDLITYNTFLKCKLVDRYGVDSIKIISPKTNKKLYTGNGCSNKCDMIRSFCKESNEISNYLNGIDYIKDVDFKIDKPIDDIVDAHALTSIKNI